VLERRIEADLILRRHVDLVGELTLLVAKNPMNENFCGLLMTALYRSGHADRALEAFRRLRTVLRHELGLEPCPWLQQLHQAVLSGDPALDTDEILSRAGSRPGSASNWGERYRREPGAELVRMSRNLTAAGTHGRPDAR
jgi:DNA-binding SARP family transcriptional activator